MKPLANLIGSLVVLMVLVTSIGCAGTGSTPTVAPVPTKGAATPSGATPTVAISAAQAPVATAVPAKGPALASPQVVVKFGSVGGLSDAGVYIAQVKGYFKEQRIEVNQIQFPGSNEIAPALASGQVDIVGMAVSAGLFNAVAGGIQLRIVGDKNSNGDKKSNFVSNNFVMRKDLVESGRYKTPADLKGLKFALTAKASVGMQQLERWIGEYGLHESDVDWVELGYPQMLVAFENKAIDGSMLLEPFLTRALDMGLVAPVGDLRETGPNETQVPLIYSEAFARDKKDAGNRFMVAYMKGVRDYNDSYAKNKNRVEITKILADATKMDESMIERMHKPGLDPNQKVNTKGISDLQDFLFDRGSVRTKIDIGKMVDPSFAEYAIKQLGGEYE